MAVPAHAAGAGGAASARTLSCALVTAQWPADDPLAAAGLRVERAGWGVTGTALEGPDLVAAAREASADLLVVEVERVDAAVLAALPDVRLVATARGAPSNVDLAAAAARGVPVLHTPGRNADSVADFVVGLVLSAARGIGRGERHLRDVGWTYPGEGGAPELPYLHVRGPELQGRTLGVVGWGAVGRRVARRLQGGFGMRLLVHDPYVEHAAGVDLPTLLAGSDVVSLHVPRGPETDGMVDADALALLPPGAVLVNTAGGAVVDVPALLAALDAGRLAAAALDVFPEEPLPRDSPLLGRDDVVLTPHLAGASDDVPRRHAEMIAQDVARWLAGERPHHRADPGVLA